MVSVGSYIEWPWEIDKENDTSNGVCDYVGNCDVVSAPRPKSVRIVTATVDEKDFSMEYGLLSSHTLNTIFSSNNCNLPIFDRVPSFAIVDPLFLPTFPNFQKLLISCKWSLYFILVLLFIPELSHLKKPLYVEVD
ncbi:hypothetical protein L2E82_34940 [Cichorium intybus]|uniref:Uncharacterized protein n=1 Tax=Cichorium intybus TaxID=13427 RepID=A0ACB9BN17_CICIN|nr:hypothetical protein L2E82_34940 [Cichorium intybus]